MAFRRLFGASASDQRFPRKMSDCDPGRRLEGAPFLPFFLLTLLCVVPFPPCSLSLPTPSIPHSYPVTSRHCINSSQRRRHRDTPHSRSRPAADCFGRDKEHRGTLQRALSRRAQVIHGLDIEQPRPSDIPIERGGCRSDWLGHKCRSIQRKNQNHKPPTSRRCTQHRSTPTHLPI